MNIVADRALKGGRRNGDRTSLAAAIFTVVAAYFFYSGYAIETTIVTPGVEGFDGIANLQLMHVQSLNFATAIGAAIIAAILAVGSAIVAAIDTQRSD